MAMLPEGWSAHDLGDLAQKIEGGGTPPRNEPSYWDGDIPWASVKDLRGVKLSTTEEFISELGLENSSSKLIPSNTMIIASRMAVGKAVFFNQDVAINQDLKAFYPKENTDGLFLLQWYLSQSEKIESLATGSTVKGIRLDDLTLLPIDLPPLPEQQKIATILSSVDDVIEKTRAQIDKLKDLKTGMMQELLTKGIGHTEFKDSPVGFIPINWEVKQIGEMVVKVGSGITPRGGSASYVDVGIPLVRSQNVHSDGLRLDNVSYITKTQHAKMSGSQLKPCDVLLNITGASIGRCYYLPSDFKEGNVNQHVCIIRLKQKILDSVFLTFCLNSESGQRQIMSLQAGGNREGLNFQQVRAIRLPVPPLDEQKKIAEIVSSIEKNICNKLAKLAHMSDTKKALMQDLLTGKVRVTPNESAAL